MPMTTPSLALLHIGTRAKQKRKNKKHRQAQNGLLFCSLLSRVIFLSCPYSFFAAGFLFLFLDSIHIFFYLSTEEGKGVVSIRRGMPGSVGGD